MVRKPGNQRAFKVGPINMAAGTGTRRPRDAATDLRDRGSRAERIVCGYLAAIPLLWIIGLTLPAALLTVFGVFAVFVRSRRALAYAWPWFLVGCCQLTSVVINLVAEGQPLLVVVRHLLASYVMGWFVLGAAIAIGASGLIRPAPFLRQVARFGLYCVVLAVPLYALAVLTGEPYLHVLTPIGRLLPLSLPSTSFFFGMLLFNWEELFGTSLPRLALFFPWTTALGFGGLCLMFVAANDADHWRRRWAVASGAFMLFASQGRLVILTLLACLVVRWFLERSRRTQSTLVSIGMATGFGVVIASIVWLGSPSALMDDLGRSFDEIRPSATRSRELVYEESWRGVHESPLFGHGWPGEAVYPEDWPQVMQGGGTMRPGSHSTFLGLLYLGGVVTLGAFVFALTRTILLVASAPGPVALTRNTLTLLCGIALIGIGESLFSVVVPTLFAFIWIGIALRQCEGPRETAAAGDARQPSLGPPRMGWAS